MSTCRTCEPIQDCNDALDQYSLQDSVFFWTLNCPPGFFCGGRDRLYLDCCDGTRESVVFPDGATAAERAALVNGLVTRCLRKVQTCTPPPPDETVLYYNTPQSCSGTCPDGSSVTVTIPAGVYSAFTQAEADAAAKEAACAAVSAPICLEDWSLACCVKQPASKRIHATGSVANWMISSGSLPTGMMISGGTTTSVLISGTPQSTGTYTFTLRAVGTNGSVTQKQYSIVVCGISTASPLTDATVGIAYNLTLTQYGMTGVTWTITSGTLPTGLTLSTAGVISGTPTTAQTKNFTVAVSGTVAGVAKTCTKAFELEVASGTTVFAYWKCDEASLAAELIDSVTPTGPNLYWVNTPTLSTAGKISTAVLAGRLAAEAMGINRQYVVDPSAKWNLSGGSMTIRFWMNTYLTGQNYVAINMAHWNWRSLGMGDYQARVYTADGAHWLDATISTEEWHRIVIYYEKNVEAGLIIDNNAAITEAASGDLDPGTYEIVVGGTGLGAGWMFDEFAIWKRKLSAAELLYDWNSGTGKTYPDVP